MNLLSTPNYLHNPHTEAGVMQQVEANYNVASVHDIFISEMKQYMDIGKCGFP